MSLSVNESGSFEITKSLIERVVKQYQELNLSENQFCKVLDINRNTWGRLVNGKQKAIDIPLLIKVAQFLGIDYKDIVELYMATTDEEEKRKISISGANSFIAHHFDLKNLHTMDFFTSSPSDFKAMEDRIKTFFGFNSIYDYREIEVPPAYSRTRRVSSDRMMQFWNTLVRYELQNVGNPNPFDRERFKNILSTFRGATRDIEFGLSRVVRALYDCGITVIVQSYIMNTSIRGGTFVIQEKPNIVLTNLGKKYATLWQVLAHECYHVLVKLDDLKRRGYRLSSDDKELFDSDLEEQAAYEFARNLFLDQENIPVVEKYIFADALIEEYAKAWNVHPSLIYNIYLWNHPNEYDKYSKFLTKSTVTIKNLEVKEPWKQENIQVSINEIKRKLTPELIAS